MSQSATLAGVLNDVLADWMRERVNVAMPARVESFDASKNAVNAKPIIRNTIEDETGAPILESLPVIPNVPLMQFGAGGMRITFPVAVGDTVLLVFCQRSLDKWKTFGGSDVDPADRRVMDLTDAVAIPGLLPFSSPWTGVSTTALTLGKDGGPQIHVSSTEIRLGGTDATHAVATAEKVATELANLQTAFNLHIHSGVTTGAGVSGPPGTPLGPFGSVASSLAKVKP